MTNKHAQKINEAAINNLPVQVRWLIRMDMSDVLQIERESEKDLAWTEEDFLCVLRQRNCIGMVAETLGRVVGFMVYELHKDKIVCLKIAGNESAKAKMLERLKEKVTDVKRKAVEITVRESNLSLCLSLKNAEYEAVQVICNYYLDTNEDGYLFRYGAANQYLPHNRISEYL